MATHWHFEQGFGQGGISSAYPSQPSRQLCPGVQFRQVAEIDAMPAGTVLDLIGIVESVGQCTPLTTRAGVQTDKRPVQIKDSSNASIEVHSGSPNKALNEFMELIGDSVWLPSYWVGGQRGYRHSGGRILVPLGPAPDIAQGFDWSTSGY